MHSTELAGLIARQRSGWSLDQPFYLSEELYELERCGYLARQWHVLAHGSELAEPGSFIVRELLGESLLIVRDDAGAARAFYNVCRHRGSRICDADGRSSRGFTCPYHAWSYRLDGSLRTAPALPENIDPAQLGLRTVPVREIGGVILGSLSGDVRSLDCVQQEFEAGLDYHGFTRARIAARRSYPTVGNWKLVLENFRECYHCLPAHPEYCNVMQWVNTIGRVPEDGGVGWAQAVEKWSSEEADPGSPLRSIASRNDDAHPDVSAEGRLVAGVTCAAFRMPIGPGKKTQSRDGVPVAPLMGRQTRFDGGVSHFLFRPFVTLMALNDHAVMFQFLPTAAQSTEVVVTWLVDAAAPDWEVDVERMVWLWDVTTLQDKRLIERNAAGVRSRSYSPGPYSKLEAPTVQFIESYLRESSQSLERS